MRLHKTNGVPTAASRSVSGAAAVLVASAAVLACSLLEAAITAQIGPWTGLSLVVASAAAALFVGPGDHWLPVMMPPLAFLGAALVGGQLLDDTGSEAWWVRQALMVFKVLGSGAAWVVAATAAGAVVGVVRSGRDRRNAVVASAG